MTEKDATPSLRDHGRKLAELEQMCSAAGDSYSSAQWCEAAGIAVEIASEAFSLLEEWLTTDPYSGDWIDFQERVEMFVGKRAVSGR